MLLIQATKKLADQLNIKPMKDENDEHDPLYAWHTHLFVFDRRKYVIVMNNKSRYNFVMGNLVKKDFIRYKTLVKEGIKENLIADGFADDIVENYLKQCDHVSFTPTSDRSIISQMNEMIQVTKYGWQIEGFKAQDIDLNDLNRDNNRFVMLTLPESYSVDAMENALGVVK